MSVNNLTEQKQIIVSPYDSSWIRQRAILLFLLGIENGPVSDFGSVEETVPEIRVGDLSPKSTEFHNFDTFFRKS